MPVGIAITLWILIKKVKFKTFEEYFWLGSIWAIIAIVFDYLFLVKLFKPVGYYKLDVFLYYALTFALPIIVGCSRKKKRG